MRGPGGGGGGGGGGRGEVGKHKFSSNHDIYYTKICVRTGE